MSLIQRSEIKSPPFASTTSGHALHLRYTRRHKCVQQFLRQHQLFQINGWICHKYHFCRDKHDKTYFCRDNSFTLQHTFVTTNTCCHKPFVPTTSYSVNSCWHLSSGVRCQKYHFCVCRDKKMILLAAHANDKHRVHLRHCRVCVWYSGISSGALFLFTKRFREWLKAENCVEIC